MANISTSTAAYATRQETGVLAFIASDGTACVLWCDGTDQKLSYASAPYSSWTTTTLVTGTYMALAGAWLAGTDNITVATGGAANINPRYYPLTKSGAAWTVGSPVLIISSVAGAVGLGTVMVYAGQDPQGRHWIIDGSSSSYTTTRAYSSVANSPTTTPWTINGSQAQTGDGHLPAGGQVGNFLLKIYWNGTALQWHRADTSGVTIGSWSTGATITGLTGSPGNSSIVCFRPISATQAILTYSTGSGIYAQTYTSATDTWGAATQLSSGANDRSPTVVADGAGNAWVVWCSYAAASNYALVYTTYQAADASWDTAATTLVASGTNINYPNGGYGAGGTLGVTFTQGTGSPYTVGWVVVTTLARTSTASAALSATDRTRTVGVSTALLAQRLITADAALATGVSTVTRTISGVSVALLSTASRTAGASSATLVTGARTATASVAVLATRPARTMGASAALLAQRLVVAAAALSVADRTRTISGASAALRAIQTKTVAPVTTSMGTTSTRTMGASAALLSTPARTVSAAAALLAQRLVSASAALSSSAATSTRTVSATVPVLSTPARTMGATLTALATSTRTVGASAALLLTSTRTVSTPAALLSTRARTSTTSAAALATRARTITPASATLAALAVAHSIPSTGALAAVASARTVSPVSASVAYIVTPLAPLSPYGMTRGMNPGAAFPVTARLNQQEVTWAAQMGLSRFRFQLDASYIWRNQADAWTAWAWAPLDDAVFKILTAGLRPTFPLRGWPTWGLVNAAQQATDEPWYLPDPATVATFGAGVASRYNGVYSIPGYGPMKIDTIEIGNEEYQTHFTLPYPARSSTLSHGIHASPYYEYNGVAGIFSGTSPVAPQPARDPYFLRNVLLVAAPAIRAAAASDVLIGAGASWWLWDDNYHDFVAGLGADAIALCDYVNFHYYSGGYDPLDPQASGAGPHIPSALDAVRGTQGALTGLGLAGFPIWCTEFGWNWVDVPVEADQATRYTQVYDVWRTSGVAQASFYTLDATTNPVDGSLVSWDTGTGTYHFRQAFATIETYIATYPLWMATPSRAVPTSAALCALGQSRSVPTTDAALSVLGQSRSIPVSVALVLTKTRTVSAASTALLITRSRGVSDDTALLLAAQTRTVSSVTTALLLAQTRTLPAPTAALLLAAQARTVGTVTSALLATQSRSVAPVSVALLLAQSRTVSSVTTALLAQRVAPASVALLAEQERSLPIVSTALLAMRVRITVDTAALRAMALTRTASAAGVLASTSDSRTIPSSAAITVPAREVPASVALLSTPAPRAVALAGVLWGSSSRAAGPASAPLLRVASRGVGPATTSLLGSHARSVLVDTPLAATRERPVLPTSAALLLSGTRAVSLSSIALLGTDRVRTIGACTAALGAGAKARALPAAFPAGLADQARAIGACAAALSTTRTRTLVPTSGALVSVRVILPVTSALSASALTRLVATGVSLGQLGAAFRQASASAALLATNATRGVAPISASTLASGSRGVAPTSVALLASGRARTVAPTLAVAAVGLSRALPSLGAALLAASLSRTVSSAAVALASTGERSLPASVALWSAGSKRSAPAVAPLASPDQSRQASASAALGARGQAWVYPLAALWATPLRQAQATVALLVMGESRAMAQVSAPLALTSTAQRVLALSLAVEPVSHAHLTLASAGGIAPMASASGAVSLTSASGHITLEGE